jgi:hypothetical protein
MATRKISSIEAFWLIIDAFDKNQLPMSFIECISRDYIKKVSKKQKDIRVDIKIIKAQYETYKADYGDNAGILTKAFIKNFF